MYVIKQYLTKYRDTGIT